MSKVPTYPCPEYERLYAAWCEALNRIDEYLDRPAVAPIDDRWFAMFGAADKAYRAFEAHKAACQECR